MNCVEQTEIVASSFIMTTPARQTVYFLSSNNVELMTHCPYSPDLSPNDFFLFPNFKNKIRGERFESPEAVETFLILISEITVLEWKKCFENWFKRMQKSILKANTSKNNKAIYRILHVFFSYCLQKLSQQPTYYHQYYYY